MGKKLGITVANSEQVIQGTLVNLRTKLPPDIQPANLNIEEFRLATARLGVRIKLVESEAATWEQLGTAKAKSENLLLGDGLESVRRNLANATDALARLRPALSRIQADDIVSLDTRRANLEESAVFARLAPLLEHAKIHLTSNDDKNCPLCGQAIDRQQLLESIDRRLQELTEYRNIVQQFNQSARRWESLGKSSTDYASYLPCMFNRQIGRFARLTCCSPWKQS